MDCVSTAPDGGVLKIQVTTPEVVAWGVIARTSEPWQLRDEVSADVKAVHGAILKKHLKGHPDIYLVLDATDSLRFALTEVVRAA